MNGMADFVAGGFPLPWEPVWHPGIGDFVMGGFPLPTHSVLYPSATGSLPKAPDMPRAAIAHGSAGPASPTLNTLSGISGIGGMGCGCGPRGFAGLGTLSSDTIIPQASLPTFLQGDSWITGVPTVYLAAGVAVVAVMFLGGRGGRRRR